MRQQDISVRAANWRFVRVLIVGIHRSERPVWNSPKSVALNDRFDDTGCTATTLILHLRENAAPAKCEIRMAGLSHIANIGTNRSEWWLFTLILFTCLISFTIHDFKNDTEQVPLALQIVAFLQTLPAS